MVQQYIGASITRKEDERFLTGRATFVDDVKLPGMVHATFVRSPHAHARIVAIDTAAALAMPGVVIAGGAMLALGLVGAGMGAWLGGMIGLDVDNTQVKEFQSAIEAGKILVLADVPKDRIDDIENLVKQHYPDADFEGVEPNIPAFP